MITDEMNFFQEATKRICSSLDIEKGMRKCLQYLALIIPADRMSFNLYDPGLGVIRRVAVATTTEGKKINLISPLSNEAKDFLQRPDLPEVRIVNRPESDPVIKNIQKYHGWPESSSIVLSLTIEGKRIGNLVLAAEGKDRYSEEHARLLSLLKEPFIIAFSNALNHQEVLKLTGMLMDDNRYLHEELRRLSSDEIIGGDFGLKRVMELVRQVAPLNSPVLLLGESGSGKDLVAKAIHFLSPRRDGPFIMVNCGAIPETLVDSELFGHEKGAFTGAIAQKRGRFERANHGTIFLDEIGELPAQAQVKILRALQSKEIERVGGSETITLDIRIIAATHRNLEKMIKESQFREDLWFRLNVFPIEIPPLRDRKADIPSLVYHFIARKSRELKLPGSQTLSRWALDQLMNYSWPGNVRELENVIERAMILSKTGQLTFDHLIPGQVKDKALPLEVQANGALKLDDVVSRHIQQVLKMTNGKVHGPGGAAELLGINPSTLRHRMNQLGISYGRNKQE